MNTDIDGYFDADQDAYLAVPYVRAIRTSEGDVAMAEPTKLQIKTEQKKGQPAPLPEWRPFEALRREVDRLFDNFGVGLWRSPFGRSAFDVEPFWRRELSWSTAPAVDIAESEKAYEVTADLPGMDEKNIEVNVANGTLTIKGEKQEQTEEKKKDYYLNERRFGSFERSFGIPEEVDESKIEANFKKGVLTVTLPKKAEAQAPAKKIEVKAA
jgi:HSP20 family protein